MIDWDCEIQPHIEPFFDSDSNTFSYLVQDPNSLSCAVIDSVLDFDYPSGSIGYESADGIIDIIKRRGLDLQWLIENSRSCRPLIGRTLYSGKAWWSDYDQPAYSAGARRIWSRV